MTALDDQLHVPVEISAQDDLANRPSIVQAVLRSPEGLVGTVVGLGMVALIVLGPFVAPSDPAAIGQGNPMEGPTWHHWLGTDQLGRDVLSRVLHGGGQILFVPVLAVLMATVFGGALGLIAGYRGGRVDRWIARIFDILLTVPPLLIVLVLVARVGPSDVVVATTVAIIFAPRTGQVVRGAAQGICRLEFVDAAIARGERTAVILWREVLPNIAGPVVADLALRLTYAIIFVSTLSFLGVGAQPPSSNWGLMVSDAENRLSQAPLLMLAPAGCIVILSISLNLIADALGRQFSAAGQIDPLVGGVNK